MLSDIECVYYWLYNYLVFVSWSVDAMYTKTTSLQILISISGNKFDSPSPPAYNSLKIFEINYILHPQHFPKKTSFYTQNPTIYLLPHQHKHTSSYPLHLLNGKYYAIFIIYLFVLLILMVCLCVSAFAYKRTM